MQPYEVETWGNFREFLQAFSEVPAPSYAGSLEDYLRALWAVVQHHRNNPPTLALFAQMLLEALTQTPPPFDEAWLAYNKPAGVVGSGPERVQDDFKELQDMLCYQIADLHRMREAGTLDNPYRYFGIESPTGQTWYNFTPADFFGNGSYGLHEGSEETECNWADLAIQLWLGQIYE